MKDKQQLKQAAVPKADLRHWVALTEPKQHSSPVDGRNSFEFVPRTLACARCYACAFSGAGASSAERLTSAAVTPTDVTGKPQQPQDSQPAQHANSAQQSPNRPLEDQSSVEAVITDIPDSTKAAPAVDSRGVWHVHVQTSATSSRTATPPRTEEGGQLAQLPPSVPAPATHRADGQGAATATSARYLRNEASALPDGSPDAAAAHAGSTGVAPSTVKSNSMPMPQLRIRVPKSNVRQLESLSQGRDAVGMQTCRSTQSGAQDTCDSAPACAHRGSGGLAVSKPSTASASSAASAESDIQSIPLAIAPQETPEDDAQHALLAKEVGVAADHAAFVLWRLTQHLGAGAFSKVLLATASGALRKDLPRTCVIKVVNLGDDCKIRSDYKPVLRAEGLALQRFSYPGFVHCYAVWGSAPERPEEKAPNHLVLALEHLRGGMLLDRLKKGPLSEHHAAAAFHQIVTCILYMHHTGFLHRDLKPDNVMLTYDWDPETDAHLPPPVKLIDLGMVLNYVKQPNETGLMGSPGYMSPEAIRGHRHTPQMDMFSLGVLLFVMLTGCKPIPSAVCTKLCYDRMDTSEFPGVKMSQFRRLSSLARDLTLSLMSRRPASRPSAMAVLSHPWMTSHAEQWYSEGVDLRDLAVPRSDVADAVRSNPRVVDLLARARAANPLPQAATRAATPCGNSTSSAAPTPAPAPFSAGASAPRAIPIPSKRDTAPTSSAVDSGALIAPTSGAPLERSFSGSRLPPLPSEHLRQLGYGEDRQQPNVGTGHHRGHSGPTTSIPEEEHHGQENIGARIVQPPTTTRTPLKSHAVQEPLSDHQTPRTRIPLVQRTSAQLNRRLSMHGNFSNSAALPVTAPGPTPNNTPDKPTQALQSGDATKTDAQSKLARRSFKEHVAPKQQVAARSFSDSVDSIIELASQQSGATVPSNSAFSGPLTAPSPALLYKKGSNGSGHGPILRTRASTQSGSLPMPDVPLPSPRLCMNGEDGKSVQRLSDPHNKTQQGLGGSHITTPRSAQQAGLPLPPLAPLHRLIGHVPQKCSNGTVYRPSAATALSPNRRHAS